MSLTTGARLNQYEVTAQLGAGGMGEVYCARDTRLQRNVAIKILPSLFATDTERLTRFEREAQVLASLNHPHIAQIYGVEESAGVLALVMELVDGPTLAELIAAAGGISRAASQVRHLNSCDVQRCNGNDENPGTNAEEEQLRRTGARPRWRLVDILTAGT
jgi:Protein kinase domain